jgi:hypothetical protein
LCPPLIAVDAERLRRELPFLLPKRHSASASAITAGTVTARKKREGGQQS